MFSVILEFGILELTHTTGIGKEIILTVSAEPTGISCHLTPVSDTQSRILALMGFSDSLYFSLALDDS